MWIFFPGGDGDMLSLGFSILRRRGGKKGERLDELHLVCEVDARREKSAGADFYIYVAARTGGAGGGIDRWV